MGRNATSMDEFARNWRMVRSYESAHEGVSPNYLAKNGEVCPVALFKAWLLIYKIYESWIIHVCRLL